MKKYKNTIIVSVLLWIPLAIVIFRNLKDETLSRRILFSVLSGPVIAFESGIIAFIVAALIAGANYVLKNLEAFRIKEPVTGKTEFPDTFNGIFGIAFVVLYYMTITNRQVFYRFFGGW